MYLSTVRPTGRSTGTVVTETKPETKVNGNVLALGTVSLVTDISSEMVTAILPLYLVLGLHVGPTAYGAVDGAYTGSTALLRLVGGYIADRVRHRKIVAGTGYAMSAVAKLGLLAAGGSVPRDRLRSSRPTEPARACEPRPETPSSPCRRRSRCSVAPSACTG